LNALSSDAAPSTSSFLSIALNAGRVADALSVTVGETYPNIQSSDIAPPDDEPFADYSDTRQVARAAPKEAALPASTSEASRKGKGKVSD